jgi:hydrogenase-4 membrane subunit HyfE
MLLGIFLLEIILDNAIIPEAQEQEEDSLLGPTYMIDIK